MHFGPNTFTDLEWGKGSEKEEIFNPTALDCRQWCRIAKAAGATGIVITAKHHDGFCLWPSAYSKHTVAQSTWRRWKGRCTERIIRRLQGIWIIHWAYIFLPGTGIIRLMEQHAYNEVFMKMMKEVVRNYGPFFEFWWDGANGEGPNGKKHDCMTGIDLNPPFARSPRIPWCLVILVRICDGSGNENGIAGTTNWNLLDTAGFSRGSGAPPNDTLNQGNVNGKNWIPAECDVSIRPGWFYHAKEDSLVKSPEKLFDIYLKSVGRGANLILNVPPDPRGLISSYDSAALMGFAKLRQESFQNLLAEGKCSQFLLNGKIITGISIRNKNEVIQLGKKL